MKSIYKYPIPIKAQKFPMLLPKNFKFLKAGLQNEAVFMWAEVVDGDPKEEFSFGVFGTGQEINNSAKYLATYEIGPFVLHLYQL